jgi:hypothetical protein
VVIAVTIESTEPVPESPPGSVVVVVVSGGGGGLVVVVVSGGGGGLVVVVVVSGGGGGSVSVVVVVGGGSVSVVVVSGGGGFVVVVVEPGGRGFLGGFTGGGRMSPGRVVVVDWVEVDVDVEPEPEPLPDPDPLPEPEPDLVVVVVMVGGTKGSVRVNGAVTMAGVDVLSRFFLLTVTGVTSGETAVEVVVAGGTSTGSCPVVVVVVLPALVPLVVDLSDTFTAAAPPRNGVGPCRWDTKKKATPKVTSTIARAKISGPRLERYFLAIGRWCSLAIVPSCPRRRPANGATHHSASASLANEAWSPPRRPAILNSEVRRLKQ